MVMTKQKAPGIDSRVLSDIRSALGRQSSSAPPPLDPFPQPPSEATREQIVGRFIEEATAVRAQVARAHSDSHAAALIADVCLGGGVREVAFSGAPLLSRIDLAAGLAARGLAPVLATSFAADEGDALISKLARCGAGVTAIEYAIAETGTLVLSSDEAHALLVSLLPPVHIAVICEHQINATIGEAVSWLGSEKMRRPQPCGGANFITGPSRTSDVELTLSIGVHGPKQLHLIILAE